jgi:iron complex outermembrane receptor protein
VHFTLGTKIEHNDYTGFEFQPSGRLQWDVTPKQMVWAAVSRAVRTPSRLDTDLYSPVYFTPTQDFILTHILHVTPPMSTLDGSSDFESETLIAYELGYRAELTDKVSASVSTFYNQYSDIRSTTIGPSTSLGFPYVFSNNLQGETYGAELNSDYQVLDWWRLHGGYDLIKEHIYIKPGETDANNGLYETPDPEQQFQIRSSMDLPENTEFDTALRWVDVLHNAGTPPGEVPAYFSLDARIAWHPTQNLELSITGQNLLEDHHPEYGYPNSTQEEIERSVYGKIAWNF